MSSSFADEIEADYHQTLLERGNLGPKQRANWSDDNRWTDQGYLARVNLIQCACGSSTRTLVGVFHRETTPSGRSRETALNPDRIQVPLDGSFPVETTAIPAKLCPSCLYLKGFKA